MTGKVFSADFKTEKELIVSAGAPISSVAKRIPDGADGALVKKGLHLLRK